MHRTKKNFTAFLSAMTLALAGTSVTASAEETATAGTTAETTTVTETTESTTGTPENSTETDIPIDEEDMKKLADEIQDSTAENETDEEDNSEHDYYADDYYDTDGNATLIKHEKIICESEEMQFIAVTTKDGNVFYILINYSADGEEDNVFFLNKVDDFDLYSLLYAGNESEQDKNPIEQAEKYADIAVNRNTDSDNMEETADETEIPEETALKQASPMNNNLLILIGVGALVIAGGAVFVLKSGIFSKKKNVSVEDFDEEYDDDYGNVTDEDNES